MDYFDWHYKISTFFLLIPPKNRFLQVPYWLVTVVHLVLMCLSAFLEAARLCLGGSGEFSSDVLIFGIAVMHFMAVNRVARWPFIKQQFDAIIINVRGINKNYSIFNKYADNPSNSTSIEEYRSKKLQQTKIYCLKLYISFVSYVALNLTVTYPLNAQNPTYQKWNPALNRTSVFRDYPYPVWFPFDVSVSDGFYWLGFFYQPYAYFFLMSSFFCIDNLGVNTAIHLTTHVNILGHALSCVDRNIDPFLNVDDVVRVKEKRLIKCIKELQKMFKCAKMLNDMFSSQLMMQELLMAIVICCSLYRVTSVTLGPEMGYLSSMVGVVAIEMFTVSWFCQDFTLEVFELLHRVYELDWINYPPKLRRVLVFLMQRLQKPFYFTMGFWMPIDMSVFLMAIKSSYSFYTLITQSGSKIAYGNHI